MSTPLDRSSVLEQYEALRLQALEGNGRGMCGHGLALFLSRGMSAWISALTALACPPSLPRCEREGSVVSLAELPLMARSDLTVLLAGMILACQEEVGR